MGLWLGSLALGMGRKIEFGEYPTMRRLNSNLLAESDSGMSRRDVEFVYHPISPLYRIPGDLTLSSLYSALTGACTR
jgi:hypothetical protein